MDHLTEQFGILIDGIRWQLILVVLFAAAVTEQVKKLPWIKKWEKAKLAEEGLHWSKELTLWLINAFLPELICINACLWIPSVLPDGVGAGLAVFIGYLSGTVSSKLHNMFMKKLLGKVEKTLGKLFNGSKESE